MSQRVRILVADQHPIFRDGLLRLLGTDPGFLIVGQTNDVRAKILELISKLSPDILLIGLPARGSHVLDILHELSTSAPSVRSIVVTACVDTPEVTRALQLGVRGIIPKDSTPEMLFNSLHSVMAGHLWIGRDRVPESGVSLRRLQAARRRTKAFGLTRRELQIARDVIAGRTNREIARQASISENTVKSHLAHIFDKLGASNRLELAVFASHHRLLDTV